MGRGRARTQDGAVAVEFALIVPLMLMLVFGVIDFGWMLNRDMLIDNVSRDGARVASLGGKFSQVCTSIRTELSNSGIVVPASCNTTASPTSIKVDCRKADNTACSATATSYDTLAVSGSTAVVTITYQYAWVTPMLSTMMGRTKTIVETTEMVVE
jgi:Flp pilus assembly protein TadG